MDMKESARVCFHQSQSGASSLKQRPVHAPNINIILNDHLNVSALSFLKLQTLIYTS